MQTLFDQHVSLGERWWDWVARHRKLSIFLLVLLLLTFAFGLGYQRFAYMQQPDANFDTSVAHPAYVDEHPRVLFDAAHYNFHKADGNYKPFADLIRHDGYEVASNRGKFTAETLRAARVLVVVNALGGKGVVAMLANLVGMQSALQWNFNAFSPEECDAVERWVADGGNLLLISDHAPTGRAAQTLSLRFGVDMSNWWVEDPEHSDPDAYSWLVFSRENGLLLSHVVTEGRGPQERVNKIVAFTGQSLKGPAASVPFMSLAGTAKEYPTRTGNDAAGRSVAGRAQGIALMHGKGRVVILGEAAMLSAQVFRSPGREIRLGMEYPGCDNRQLALNIMHWLSGALN